eukprot:6488253-Amphidinium_carterae.1
MVSLECPMGATKSVHNEAATRGIAQEADTNPEVGLVSPVPLFTKPSQRMLHKLTDKESTCEV